MRNGHGPAFLFFEERGHVERGLLLALDQEQTARRCLEGSQPAQKVILIGMAGEAVDLGDLGLRPEDLAVDPDLGSPLEDLPAERAGRLVSPRRGSSIPAAGCSG